MAQIMINMDLEVQEVQAETRSMIYSIMKNGLQKVDKSHPNEDLFYAEVFTRRLLPILATFLPSSSAQIPMSICTLQCLFSHSFTTYE
jgi:hypothetical protein